MRTKIITIVLGILISFTGWTIGNSKQSGDITNNSGKQTPEIIKNVKPEKFSELIATGEGIILDIRTPKEVAKGYIKEAMFVNFYDDEFEKKINLMKKDKPVFVYCRSGHRSAKAAGILEKNGFKNVYNLLGGIKAWTKGGHMVTLPEEVTDDKIQE